MQSTPGKQTSSSLLRRVVYGAIFGLLLYGVSLFFLDARELTQDVTKVGLPVFIAALALSLVNYFFRWVKWEIFLRTLGLKVPARRSALIFCAGMVMAISPGKVGELVKSAFLYRDFKIAVERSAPVVFMERLTDLMGLLVLAGCGVLIFDFGRYFFLFILCAVLASILVLPNERIFGVLIQIAGRMGGPALEARVREAHLSLRSLLSIKVLATTTLLSVVSWSFEALAFYLILDALGAANLTLLLAFFVYGMTTLLGAVSFLPGGLGVTEGTMAGALLALGAFASTSLAAAATGLIRLTTLWFGVAIGLVAFLIWKRHPLPTTSDAPEARSHPEG